MRWAPVCLLSFFVLLVMGAACARPAVQKAPSPAPGPVLWAADRQARDLSSWEEDNGGGVFTTGTGTATIDQTVTHNGDASIRLAITDADGEHGNQAVRLFRWKETSDESQAYFGAWYYFPERYQPVVFWNVWQFKSKTPDRNDPFWILNIGNRRDGQMFFYLFDWPHGRSYEQDRMNIPVGQWIYVEAFYQVASDDTGHVTFWQDGVPLFDVPNVQTKYADGDAQWSVDNYTDNISPSTATIYVSRPVISRVRLKSLSSGLYNSRLVEELPQ